MAGPLSWRKRHMYDTGAGPYRSRDSTRIRRIGSVRLTPRKVRESTLAERRSAPVNAPRGPETRLQPLFRAGLHSAADLGTYPRQAPWAGTVFRTYPPEIPKRNQIVIPKKYGPSGGFLLRRRPPIVTVFLPQRGFASEAGRNGPEGAGAGRTGSQEPERNAPEPEVKASEINRLRGVWPGGMRGDEAGRTGSRERVWRSDRIFGPGPAAEGGNTRSIWAESSQERTVQEGVRGAARHMRRPRLSTWRLFLSGFFLSTIKPKRGPRPFGCGPRRQFMHTASMHLCEHPYAAPRRRSTICRVHSRNTGQGAQL